MAAVTYRLTWPDNVKSTVTVAFDERGQARVRVAGRYDGLSPLFNYKTGHGVETELQQLAAVSGFNIVKAEPAEQAPTNQLKESEA